jgi:hypothetical protein
MEVPENNKNIKKCGKIRKTTIQAVTFDRSASKSDTCSTFFCLPSSLWSLMYTPGALGVLV